LVAAVSAVIEYKNLRERVVLTYAAMCLCAASFACHVVVSHNLPKLGSFWIPWTSLGLTVTFAATLFYLLTMQSFVGHRGRAFRAVLFIQLALVGVALSDALLYALTERSFLFVPTPRPNLSTSQLELGEGAYSLLPASTIVAASFMLSYLFGVAALLVQLIRTRSRDWLVYVGLAANAAIVVNETLIALSVYSGWYLIAFSKAFETARIHKDIRVRAQARIERRLRQAEKMEAVGRVAGGIAHDFNNILAAVGGSVELASEVSKEGDPTREELALAREALEAGRQLVRQLLDVARAEETQAECVDIHAFLADSKKLLAGMVSSKAALEISVEPQVGKVLISPSQLTQILMNLVINARDAMPNGGTIRIDASAPPAGPFRFGETRASTQVVISVSDQGSGIPREALEHVFEPFFTTKAAQGGSGLGLATLYSIVRKAGGHIDVESQVGRGTRFDVFLPRHRA
jgi:signal transduction histidine kinase